MTLEEFNARLHALGPRVPFLRVTRRFPSTGSVSTWTYEQFGGGDATVWHHGTFHPFRDGTQFVTGWVHRPMGHTTILRVADIVAIEPTTEPPV